MQYFSVLNMHEPNWTNGLHLIYSIEPAILFLFMMPLVPCIIFQYKLF